MKKKCSVPSCGRPHKAKGFCATHYWRHRHGLPMREPFRTCVRGTLGERIAAYVDVDPKTGCHVWRGGIGPTGYGVTSVERNPKMAHRVAWELANGPIPEGKLVLHQCDNRRCCNPEHLKLGTAKDNARERVERKRTKGCHERDLERNPQWRCEVAPGRGKRGAEDSAGTAA